MRPGVDALPAGLAAAPAGRGPWIEARGLQMRFGAVAALQDVNLRICPGERVALIGPNGCGKTTLLRVLHGLLRPTGGQLQRDAGLREAMLFQRPFMLRVSARNNVALGLWLRGTPWAEAKARALAALQRVGLDAIAERNARTLSGGQMQRVAMARAWALEPQVLLLDEPTASLDPHAKREVEGLMAQFAASGTTLVFSSHNLGQVKRLATRVLYLQGGRVLADLPAGPFFNGPLGDISPEAELFVKGELG